jgi:hypothetical protein
MPPRAAIDSFACLGGIRRSARQKTASGARRISDAAQGVAEAGSDIGTFPTDEGTGKAFRSVGMPAW